MVEFFRGKILDHLTLTNRSELDYNSGYRQPRFLLRPGLIEGNMWLDALFEYCERFITFDFGTLERMWRLMFQFQPLDLFTTLSPTEILLLWVQLEKYNADEALIHLVINALKLRVMNPTLGLSQRELHKVIAKFVFEAVTQTLAPFDVAQEMGTNDFRPAAMMFHVIAEWLPSVTFSVSFSAT